MEKLKIVISCDDVEENVVEKALENVDETHVSFNDSANINGELMCNIVTLAVNIPSVIVALLTLKNMITANKKVSLYTVDGNLIKANVKLKDVEGILLNIERD